jgi:hypothetical protein
MMSELADEKIYGFPHGDGAIEEAPGRDVDPFSDGLLWLINRTVFHPRGYALAIDQETLRWSVLGDGTEPWRFEITDEIEDAKFIATQRVMPGRYT